MGTVAGERRARIDDTTRERVVLQNQLFLGAVVLAAMLFVIMLQEHRSLVPFVIGAGIVFLATGAAVVVPWNRVPHALSVVIPAVDIVAILLLREGAPIVGLGLLWIFPAMWISSSFGLAGLLAVAVGVSTLHWAQLFVLHGGPGGTMTFLLPVLIIAVAIISYFSARRADAQRKLLDKQSRQLQRALDRARRQEDIVTEVLEAVDFGVIRIAPDGALVVTNDAHARLQRAEHDAQGKTLTCYAADGTTPLPPYALPLARARRGETFENELVWYGDPGDERRALSVTARVLLDIDGSHAGTIMVSRDVTVEELALRAREDLIASVSHELRTPLTSILGYLGLTLDDDSLSPAVRRNVTVAERNAERLLGLVADILAISALSRQGVPIDVVLEETDLAEVARAAIESVAPRAQERHITIDAAGVEETIVVADAHRVRQVLDNLLSNAVKYNREGGLVEVGVSSDGLHAWILVRDTGLGIAEQEIPRLFERFFRADAVRKTTTHGSGLGLAISREIVRAHGGEITVQSSLGEGSTFLVRLPVSSQREDA